MKDCLWVIDKSIIERHDNIGFPSLDEAAIELGKKVCVCKYKPFSNELDKELIEEIDGWSGPVVFSTTIEMMNLFKKYINESNICPGYYCNKEELKYSCYSPVYGELMLNSDYIMLPWRDVMRKGHTYFGKKFFIRPNVVTKSFAGKLIDFDNISENPYALSQYHTVDNSEICVIASPKEIQFESRHLIVNKKVVAQSTYHWEYNFYVTSDVVNPAMELAEMVANNNWQPDYVYIVDIGVTDNIAKIIEFNSFSCAGLYGMNTYDVINTVSEMALKEWSGDL